MAQAGIVFCKQSEMNNQSVVSRLVGNKVCEIPQPQKSEFDIRNESDIMVMEFDDICVICNDHLTWDLIEKNDVDASHIYKELKHPKLFIAYCFYPTGGSYGYSYFENGAKTRARLQTDGVPHLPSILEMGSPKKEEEHWLSASSYLEEDDCPPEEQNKIYFHDNPRVEIPEHDLTYQLLIDVMTANFGVVPFDTDIQPKYTFYKKVEKIQKEPLASKENNSCTNCEAKIGYMDIFKAGLPNLISCGQCGSRVKFNINPYVEYPLILIFFILCCGVAFYFGNYLISNDVLPIKNKYIVLGVGISFALLFETLFTAWLLKMKKIIA